MELFSEILKNSALKFVDENNPQQTYTLRDIDEPRGQSGRRLAFLYIDNAWPSVKMLLGFLKSKSYAIALLSPVLAQPFKSELEDLYKPSVIVDFSRQEIPHYVFNREQSYFEALKPAAVEIHIDIKLLLSTSGTTGSPKFVKLSEDNLIQNAISISKYLPINSEDVTPLNLPVYYSYGLSVLTSNALKGGTVVCTNTDVLNREFWNKMETIGYTSIAGVPFVYEMLDRIGFTKKQYPSLRYFTQAGGRLQESLITKFADYASACNISFFVMYGQTEATARMSYVPPAMTKEKLGSIGIAIPGGHFKIDEETNELLYTGPNVSGGYVSCPEDLATFGAPEWLNTGDMARVDPDGYYYITGRIKRFVKLFGNRINLDEVERLLAHEFKESIWCVGLDDKAILIVGNNPHSDLKIAASFVVQTLKLHPTVVKTFVAETMPLTLNGKPDYTAAKKIYMEQ
jgi:long-chain acyl-CoA synthetase